MDWSPESIIQLRKRLGWGRQELAHRLGVKLESVSRLESGELKLDKSMISQLDHLKECIQKHVENIAISSHVDEHFQNNQAEQIHRNELNLFKNN